MFHIHALYVYFISHNNTDKCMYVKCVYHALFIMLCFSCHNDRHQVNLQDCKESKQNVIMPLSVTKYVSDFLRGH